ncbi:16S rRNA (guanine(527)-N(7))-methyltransferase RsmG [Phorcysia thermohydrogeniphila]|uniref:Ribosomal RNA small subunit methyltransferase G n=1 Tax=Phorcysia thermohydrogeniphila TaxID=936138 RepID=A0A4R1GBQ1_9BACT|nr:16S rRNA (guanine(527)-N(7))-methyltransferase RsmG [Phorcysia thermohydrogeniphila]TCK05208.1 16S rRNA m(7)G-527 methyltransferase [Phorcysia thermohydrogeniphila]
MALERLKELCFLNGIELKDEHLEKFERYKELLKKWGRKINLTSILNDREIEEKHFFDSLLGLKAFEVYGFNPEGKSFCDVGSGAGFPGVPLAIVLKNSTFTLVESRHKKCVFLEQLRRELRLSNVKVSCCRIEEHEGDYDMLLMRAVKDPKNAVKMTEHLLKRGALLCIYRGKEEFKGELPEYKLRKVSLELAGVNFKRQFLIIHPPFSTSPLSKEES